MLPQDIVKCTMCDSDTRVLRVMEAATKKSPSNSAMSRAYDKSENYVGNESERVLEIIRPTVALCIHFDTLHDLSGINVVKISNIPAV